jgi:N-succinyldiaminopimelate aminotransferase
VRLAAIARRESTSRQTPPLPLRKAARTVRRRHAESRLRPISLGIGEPKHPTPAFIEKALAHAVAGLSNYPSTVGGEPLRAAIAGWLERRYGVPASTRPRWCCR